MEQNFYTVLGISPAATQQEVKQAYKKLAIKYHPDKNPGNRAAEDKFKLVNTAYQTLSNPGKRARYDLKLQYLRERQRVVQQYQPYYNQRYRQTREPAPVSERYYHNIRTEERRFSRKDLYITISFVGGILLFSLLLKVVMDHISGEDKYKTALTYIADGKYSSAHRMLSDAIQFKPKHTAAYKERGRLELTVFEDYEAALQDFNQAIALEEKPSAEVYFMRGVSKQHLSSYQQAEADLSKAILLNEKLWDAYLARGEVRLFYLQKYKPALSDLSTYLRYGTAKDKRIAALTYRGFGYYKIEAWKLSEHDYRRALAIDNDNGRVHYLMGRTKLELQEPDSACIYFGNAYDLGYSAALLELRANCY
ncbi:tetratricopeptide repeat protein [Pontibacter fetidus]|uniref:DnaJ domain-containing protein n=1 Tax=Pontibacter fetidus TaxID=2700082 RepID=A0A6B2GV57_9BACT|nr:J domain-containing protein [Pontibacter fetidus]NDK54789.1 DnaJ domain-containing protein [Pontibacter fetidus]